MSAERRIRGLCLILLWTDDEAVVRHISPRFTEAVLELEEKILLQRTEEEVYGKSQALRLN